MYIHTNIIYVLSYMNNDMICFTRSYKELVHRLIDEGDEFVDADWEIIAQIKTVESVSEFASGWRPATLYRVCTDHERYFGGGSEEYMKVWIRTDRIPLLMEF